jgi:molecular chaperone GrpE
VKKAPKAEGEKSGGAEAAEGSPAGEKESEQMKAETGKEESRAAEAPEAPSEENREAGQEEVSNGAEREEGQGAEASGADSAQAEVSPEERMEELVKENEELQDKFVRLMADFDNYKKRASKEKSDIIQFGNEGLLKDFLSIIDNIERLLTYSYGESSWKNFQEGIELLLTEVNKTLANYGVEPIEALGKAFDPNLHQAMQRSETVEVEANTVVEVYQKGYVYRGRLLRPSLVVVAVPPKGEEETEEGEEASGPDDLSRAERGAGAEGEDEESPVN